MKVRSVQLSTRLWDMCYLLLRIVERLNFDVNFHRLDNDGFILVEFKV